MTDLVFYRNDGLAAVGHIDSSGKFVNTGSQNVHTQNWSIIVPATDFGNELLLYRNDGLASVGPIHPSGFGNQTPIQNLTHNWSKIIPVIDHSITFHKRNLLFFRNDGRAAVGHITTVGEFNIYTFVNTDNRNNFTQNWSQIATFGNFSGSTLSAPNQLLFYRNDGRAAVGHIHFVDGKFVNTDAVDNFTENWSQIVDTPLLIS
jgi:hypothetical protein